MHAACCVPDVLARNRFDPEMTPTRERLEAILASVDGAVGDSLFALLDRLEAGGRPEDLTAELRTRNLAVAIAAARDLAECGLAASEESLREAVRKDSGL
jgi:hypothetical protein